jgi:hypothetical protein
VGAPAGATAEATAGPKEGATEGAKEEVAAKEGGKGGTVETRRKGDPEGAADGQEEDGDSTASTDGESSGKKEGKEGKEDKEDNEGRGKSVDEAEEDDDDDDEGREYEGKADSDSDDDTSGTVELGEVKRPCHVLLSLAEAETLRRVLHMHPIETSPWGADVNVLLMLVDGFELTPERFPAKAANATTGGSGADGQGGGQGIRVEEEHEWQTSEAGHAEMGAAKARQLATLGRQPSSGRVPLLRQPSGEFEARQTRKNSSMVLHEKNNELEEDKRKLTEEEEVRERNRQVARVFNCEMWLKPAELVQVLQGTSYKTAGIDFASKRRQYYESLRICRPRRNAVKPEQTPLEQLFLYNDEKV